MCDVVKKSSRSLSHLLMSSCLHSSSFYPPLKAYALQCFSIGDVSGRCYGTILRSLLSVLSVTLVYCGQTVEWVTGRLHLVPVYCSLDPPDSAPQTVLVNESLYLQYNTLPPVQLFNYQVLNLVQKTVFSPYLLPAIFQNYFIPTSSLHRYETGHNKLYLTHVNRFGQRMLRYKGTQIWGRLPNNLSNNMPQSFRNKLKLLLICDPM